MSEATHLAAVLALMGGAARGALSLDDIETRKKSQLGLPPSYNEVHVMERLSDGPRRTSLPSETTQWRVLVRSVADDYTNAQEMRRRAGLLHEAALVVAGKTYYLERSTSNDPIAPDSGWWSGTSEYVY